MRVHVRTLQTRGRNLNRDELKSAPPYVGQLQVAEARDVELHRALTRARLVDDLSGTDADVLPELSDARLLFARGGEMRLTGFERIGSVDYRQTWVIELGREQR